MFHEGKLVIYVRPPRLWPFAFLAPRTELRELVVGRAFVMDGYWCEVTRILADNDSPDARVEAVVYDRKPVHADQPADLAQMLPGAYNPVMFASP